MWHEKCSNKLKCFFFQGFLGRLFSFTRRRNRECVEITASCRYNVWATGINGVVLPAVLPAVAAPPQARASRAMPSLPDRAANWFLFAANPKVDAEALNLKCDVRVLDGGDEAIFGLVAAILT